MIDENEMSVVVLPPTPQKSPPPTSSHNGVSTQILPLSRLSLSSSSSPPLNGEPGHDKGKANNKVQLSPVRNKIKSLAEPLLQYFHDLQVSHDSEEPEILNTPKSVAPAFSSSNQSSPNVVSHEKGFRARNLFSLTSEKEQTYENMPPIIITDM